MTEFVRKVVDDVTHGRESWRVLTLASLLSFGVAVAVHLSL